MAGYEERRSFDPPPPGREGSANPAAGKTCRRVWILAAICGVYALPGLLALPTAFLRHHEGICATHAMHARSHVYHGLAVTKLGLLEIGGPDLSAYDDYRDGFYPNRPFLPLAVSALFFAVLGAEDWVFRLNLLIAGVATVLALAAVARRIVGEPWDLVAAGFFAVLPIVSYFSHIAIHLNYAVLFSLLAWYANLRVAEGSRFRIALFVFVALACFSDWPGCFAAVSIAVHRFRGLRSGLSAGILGVAVACGALHFLHLAWLVPGGGLIKEFLIGGHYRSVAGGLPPARFLLEEGAEILLYFTVGACILAAAGTLDAVRRRSWALLCLPLLGLEELAFTYLAAGHDFLTYPLAPFVAIAAAAGCARLWSRTRGRLAAGALAGLALVQAVPVAARLHLDKGDYEVPYRAALAIREAARPEERVLSTIGDAKRLGAWYSRRAVTSREIGDVRLSTRYAGPHVRIPSWVDFASYVRSHGRRFDVLVAGDLEALAASPSLMKELDLEGKDLERAGFLPAGHPLRTELLALDPAPERRGPFLLHRPRRSE